MFNNISTHLSNAKSIAFEYKDKIATFFSESTKSVIEFAEPKFNAFKNYPIKDKAFTAIELTKDQARKHPVLASIICAIPVVGGFSLWAYKTYWIKEKPKVSPMSPKVQISTPVPDLLKKPSIDRGSNKLTSKDEPKEAIKDESPALENVPQEALKDEPQEAVKEESPALENGPQEVQKDEPQEAPKDEPKEAAKDEGLVILLPSKSSLPRTFIRSKKPLNDSDEEKLPQMDEPIDRLTNFFTPKARAEKRTKTPSTPTSPVKTPRKRGTPIQPNFQSLKIEDCVANLANRFDAVQ